MTAWARRRSSSAEGFPLAGEAFGGQGPLAAGRQQVVAAEAGLAEGLIGGLQFGLEPLPAVAVGLSAGGGLGGLQVG